MSDDKRLIEDYLPIDAISAEASNEKSARKGHISMIHLWWARRPLVACRAAIYGALVPTAKFEPANGPIERRASLTRANAAKFVKALCQYPAIQTAVAEAEKHVLDAHATRLSQESGKTTTVADILAGRAPRPRVLDMFAGGGAIPLEALRLGCEAYALELNPVAHVIELCTLTYPERYGKPDSHQKGCAAGDTWAGLAKEVEYWGKELLKKVKRETAALYPPVPDPDFKGRRPQVTERLWAESERSEVPPGYIVPIAYLWTRTVVCVKPGCKGTVPLVRQTWLCRRKDHYVALRRVVPRGRTQVRYEVVEASSEKGLGFEPEVGSSRGNATCPFCGTVADSDYVKAEGCAGRIGEQLIGIVCIRPGTQGKIYLSAEESPSSAPDLKATRSAIDNLCSQSGLTVPDEQIEDRMTGGICLPYGLTRFGQLLSARQLLTLLTFASEVVKSGKAIQSRGYDPDRARAIIAYLALLQSTITNANSTLCRWIPQNQQMGSTFARQALPMTWDYAEIYPFGGGSGDTEEYFERLIAGIEAAQVGDHPAHVERGSAIHIPWPDATFDAVITDPPYYDNVDYAKISDFFYVWLRRTLGTSFPEHFAAAGTPKKQEAVADPVRHGRSREKAKQAYEDMMAGAFREAHRVLKPGGQMTVVYAHKTTLGWATLVDSLRQAGFTVTEAWPLDTEKPGRMVAVETAALASSIFLSARKRDGHQVGQYEAEVRPELESIVRERVDSLWDLGITGADLVISCVGAGLRAFTRYAKVEYANGEEVPAMRFLTEVETVVLEGILGRLSKEVGGNGGRYGLASVDAATRFYTLWRYTYKAGELDPGEAIIFSNGTHVELDGLHSLSSGSHPLVQKRKGSYRLLDYNDRGDDASLGLPYDDGQPAPLIDALHRLLWLMERHPSAIPDFLLEARPNNEQMRLVAQALAGPALKGGELGEVATGTELAALTKLTANWRSVVEDVDLTRVELEARRAGQSRIQFDKGGRR